LVLWVIALLTVMALGLTAAQRTESMLTANALDGAAFRAAADAAVAYAALNLLASPTADPDAPQTGAADEPAAWLPDGTQHAWTFAEIPLAIAVHNEASRVDLNFADANLLTALLAVLGVPDEDGAALADRILDWRDPDDLKGLNGAEDPDYAAEDLRYGAKDGPFASVEELRLVMGMAPELYRRLAPEVTVDTGVAQVDEQFASPAVLAAVQGVTLEEAQLAVVERTQPAFPGALPGGGVATQGRGGPLYRIRVARATADADAAGVAATTAGQPTGVNGPAMEALVHVVQGGQPPVRVLWRRYGLAPPPPLPADEPGDKWR
jgi:general secretion pathway protein K